MPRHDKRRFDRYAATSIAAIAAGAALALLAVERPICCTALPCLALDRAGGAGGLWLPAANAYGVDLHRHAAGRGDWPRLPQRRHSPARAGAHLSAADQDHHCAAVVRDAGGRHCGSFQSAASGPAGTSLHHLLRGRHHHRDFSRPRRHQPQQSGRRRSTARDDQHRYLLASANSAPKTPSCMSFPRTSPSR